jgi:hypothetical protein
LTEIFYSYKILKIRPEEDAPRCEDGIKENFCKQKQERKKQKQNQKKKRTNVADTRKIEGRKKKLRAMRKKGRKKMRERERREAYSHIEKGPHYYRPFCDFRPVPSAYRPGLGHRSQITEGPVY